MLPGEEPFDVDALAGSAAPENEPAVIDNMPYSIDLGTDESVGGAQTTGPFERAVTRGTDQMQASLFAAANAIGEVAGIDPIAEWGDEGMRRNLADAALNPAFVAEWDDVDSLSSLGTKIVEAVGEQVPNIATMIAGGGAGGAAAKMFVAGIGKAALKKASVGGAAAVNYPMQVGEVQSEFKEAGIDEPGTALLAGVPRTALDVYGLERVLSTAFKGLEASLAKDLVEQMGAAYARRGLLGGAAKGAQVIGGQAARGAGMGFLAEAPTEVAQEMIGIAARAYHDPSYDPFGDEAQSRLKEAFLSGGVVGGAFGGAGRGAATSVGMLREALAGLDVPPPPTQPPTDGAPPPTDGAPPPTDGAPPPTDGAAPAPADVGPSGTTREPVETIRDQIRAYQRGEQGPVFVDTAMDDPRVAQLAAGQELVPVEGNGGVYFLKPDDVPKYRGRIERERKARNPKFIDRIRSSILGMNAAKADIEPATARVRETVGTDGAVIRQEVVDDKSPAPELNQREKPVEQVLEERAQQVAEEDMLPPTLRPFWAMYRRAFADANPGQTPQMSAFLEEFVRQPRGYLEDDGTPATQEEVDTFTATAVQAIQQLEQLPSAQPTQQQPIMVRRPFEHEDTGETVYRNVDAGAYQSELQANIETLNRVLECIG